MYRYNEWKRFKAKFRSTGEWDGGVPLPDPYVISGGPTKVDLTDSGTYVIVLGLSKKAFFQSDETPSPASVSLEYWVYD